MNVAIIQMGAGLNNDKNDIKAEGMVHEAVNKEAKSIKLLEMFH
jgi:hypothetical protein